MKIFCVFLQLMFFVALSSVAYAQSAKEDFDEYERNFSQITANSKPFSASGSLSIEPSGKPPRPGTKGKPPRKPTPPQKPPTVKPKVTAPNVGLPGMKIWLEKQTNCKGAFATVAPTSVFETGDCVRVKFRLNFDGYLTIINRGSSGSIDKIYPLKNQSNRISPKTDNFIPDNRGWEFYNEAGNENLFFIVSKAPIENENHREIEGFSGSDDDSDDVTEVYDRDLRPRTEKNEVFVLANETRLEKPLIFRLTLKHR